MWAYLSTSGRCFVSATEVRQYLDVVLWTLGTFHSLVYKILQALFLHLLLSYTLLHPSTILNKMFAKSVLVLAFAAAAAAQKYVLWLSTQYEFFFTEFLLNQVLPPLAGSMWLFRILKVVLPTRPLSFIWTSTSQPVLRFKAIEPTVLTPRSFKVMVTLSAGLLHPLDRPLLLLEQPNILSWLLAILALRSASLSS